jgi:hypothetical protein
MYNSETPTRAELPSTRQLIGSTLMAAAAAVVLLYSVVLPAEYGVDPTGLGRILGLTEMGEIKTRLAKEAAEDAAAAAAKRSAPSSAAAAPEAAAPTAPTTAASVATPAATTSGTPAWRDEIRLTLTPGQGTEIKLKMKQGEKALFSWQVEGGVVNFDTHGDAPGRSISYEKGRGVAADDGELVASFTGNHGWYWRNRGQANVTLVLRTAGDYSNIQRAK